MLGVHAAQNAVELRVEAAVPESEQEAAQQGDGHADGETRWVGHCARLLRGDVGSEKRSPPPLPGSQERFALGGRAKDDGGVVRDVEEDQVDGDEVDDHPQEDHGGPPEAVVGAQQPEQAAASSQRTFLLFI